MKTQQAINMLQDYNTKLTDDNRFAISELLTAFELFRQHTLMRVTELESSAHALPRD